MLWVGMTILQGLFICSLSIFFSLPVQAGNPVSCLGRLVPGDEVLLIQVPYFMQEPAVVEEVLVKEGDRIKKDQILARTHHSQLAKVMVAEAQSKLDVARSNLALVKAGAEPTVIAAQLAQVKSMQAEAELEDNLYKRRVDLQKAEAISQEELDSARLRTEASRKRTEQAEKIMLSLSTVQKEKIGLADAEVAEASATLERVKALFDLTEIHSPINGRVLKIYSRSGEKAEEKGLMEIGDTDRMRVEAEVYVSDIRYVTVGQKVLVQSEAFEGKLDGKVESIDPVVKPNRLVDADPKAPHENRAVSVHVSLDNPVAVENLSGAEVSVVIQP